MSSNSKKPNVAITGTAKIHFKYCVQVTTNMKWPIQSISSDIIINGNHKPFISKAIEFLRNNPGFLDEKIVVSCEDSNFFMDCKTVGETIGKIFTYQVDC